MHCSLFMRHICLQQTDVATPLYAASFNGHVEVVRALLGAGEAVNQAKVSWGGRAKERGTVCVCGVSVGGGGV